MALLLAMFQKLRLKREYNQCALNATKFSSKIGRIEKSIQRAQKRYTSLFAQIDAQAKMMTTQAKNSILNGFGLGSYGNNGLTAIGGMSAFVSNAMFSGLTQQGIKMSKDGDPITLSEDEFKTMYSTYMQQGNFYARGEDGQPIKNDDGTYEFIDGVDKEKAQAFMWALNCSKTMEENARRQANDMSTQYESNVSIWVEAQKARLEAEQDAVLEPLNYEQTMLELDKTLNDEKMQRIKAEMESYDQLCSEEAKNSAPTFGLR